MRNLQRSLGLSLVGSIGLLACVEAASAVGIQLNPGTHQASRADDSIGDFAFLQHTLSANASAWNQTTSATDSSVYGTSAATVVTNLGQTMFDLDFTLSAFHRQSNITWGESHSYGTVYFTALEYLAYQLSGALGYSGGGASISQRVLFVDDSTGAYLHDSHVNSTSASLALTGGGLSGTLVAGHNYRLFFEYRLAHNLFNGTRNGSGDLTLLLTPVPEPGTGLLALGGLLGLAAARRGRNAWRQEAAGRELLVAAAAPKAARTQARLHALTPALPRKR